jgi:hypothetical protein
MPARKKKARRTSATKRKTVSQRRIVNQLQHLTDWVYVLKAKTGLFGLGFEGAKRPRPDGAGGPPPFP